MDKNSFIGLVLIGLILFGFTWYQSRQYNKQMEIQAQLDSVARVEALQRAALDSAAALTALPDSVAAEGQAPQASMNCPITLPPSILPSRTARLP